MIRSTSQVILASLISLCYLNSLATRYVAADTPVELRYQFERGQVFRYQVSLKDDYLITLGSVSDEPHSYQDSIKSFRVVTVNDDGSAEIEVTFEWVKFDIFQDGTRHRFDTRRDKKPDPIFQQMADLVGKPHARLTMSPTGEVTHAISLVDRGKEIEDIENGWLILPAEPIAVGGLWTEDVEVPLAVPNSQQLKQNVRLQRRYVVTSITDSVATIDMKTKVLTPVSDPELEMQLIRRTPSGKIEIDFERGVLLRRELTQNNQVLNFSQGPSKLVFKQHQSEKWLPKEVATESQVPIIR